MDIIFSKSITNIRVLPKSINWDTPLIVLNSFKRMIGTKYLIIPVYEVVPNAVINQYASFSGEFYSTVEEFNKTSEKCYIEGNTIYYKPHCTIFYSVKGYKDVFFETIEELNLYVDELKTIGPHIIINN
jgi:hypothetical protein